MNSKYVLCKAVMGVSLLGLIGLLSACGGGGGGSSSGGTTLTQMGGSKQGSPLVLTKSVTTISGFPLVSGSDDGTTTAKFNSPYSITTDGTNLYVADSNNSTIRKIVIATGAVTTVAGTALATGSIDDTGAAARFAGPDGITTDGTNLYVADTFNHTIRKIVIATGAVTTVSGSAGVAGATDGTAAARFSYPHGITTDGVNLYVADSGNSTIRQIIIATGAVSTVAGSAGVTGSTDGTAAAKFKSPQYITTDGANLYVADTGNHTIRKIVIATGAVTTLSGSAGMTGVTDGTSAARFDNPDGLTTDGVNLYVADTGNNTIRKIVISTHEVTTLAGSSAGSADGISAAKFNNPYGITNDGANLYVADTFNHTIRKIQ